MTIRVLRIITRLNVGGPAKQVFLLQNELPKNQFDQKVIVGKVGLGETEVDLTSYGDLVQLSTIRRGINPMRDFLAVRQITRIVKDFQPDVIHTHLSKAWLLATIAKTFSKKKCMSVHTFHGHILHSYFSQLTNFAFLVIQKYAAFKTQKLISVGHRIKDELIAAGIGNDEKFIVINPGILDAKAPGSLIRHLGEDAIRLLFVGRLEPIKRPEFILEVCERLRLLGVEYQMTMVGDGSLMGKLRKASEQRNLNITFEGMKLNIEPFYSSNDLLLICSANEGTPMVIIEASRYSMPTLSNKIGSVQDLIEDGKTGFLVQASVDAYVLKIIELDRDRNKLISIGANCRESFNERFKKDVFLKKHIECYVT